LSMMAIAPLAFMFSIGCCCKNCTAPTDNSTLAGCGYLCCGGIVAGDQADITLPSNFSNGLCNHCTDLNGITVRVTASSTNAVPPSGRQGMCIGTGGVLCSAVPMSCTVNSDTTQYNLSVDFLCPAAGPWKFRACLLATNVHAFGCGDQWIWELVVPDNTTDCHHDALVLSNVSHVAGGGPCFPSLFCNGGTGDLTIQWI
jgi:hypothetical protein